MAVRKVKAHTRVINGKAVTIKGSSRVVGKPGPKVAEARAKVEIKREKPPTLPVMPDTYARAMKLCEERGVSADTLISVALRSLEANRGRHYDLETPMGFGKYASETFEAVVRLDPNYVRWMPEQQRGVTLTDRAQSMFNIWMRGG